MNNEINKAKCQQNLEEVILLANEMIKSLNGDLEVDPDYPEEVDEDPIHYFMECYESLNHALTGAVVSVVKAHNPL